MGSRLSPFKNLGARVSLATLTAQIALGSLSLGLMPTMALAASTTLYATAEGSPTSWTIGAGASKIIAVGSGDATDTSYVTTSAGNDVRQLFTFSTAGITAGSTINSVTIHTVAKKNGGGSPDIKMAVGTTNVGSSISLTGSYADYATSALTTNPATGLSWTLASLASANIGVVTTNASGTARVSQIYLVIDYTAPLANGTLTVNRTITNDNGGPLVAGGVTLQIDGGTVTSGLSNSVTAASHTVSANAVSGYTMTIGGDCAPNGTVTVPSAGSKVCSVTYDDIQPKITVTKTVVNDDGGTKIVSDFPLMVGATSVTSGIEAGINAGTYTVSETTDAGYTASFGGDCDTDGSITLAVGGTYSCTVKNDDLAPILTVIKTVVGGTATSEEFTMEVTGTGDTLIFSGSSIGTVVSLDAGAYAVTESMTGPTGYVASYSADCSGTLALGDAKVCTITNTKQTMITVIKQVIDSEEGAKTATGFSLLLSGSGVTHNVAEVVIPGSYVVDEVADVDYAKSYGAECVEGNVNVAAGEDKSCTIINTAIFVPVCHAPPGNPDNKHTVQVRPSELEAHLAHFTLDTEGACTGEGENGDGVLICHNDENKFVTEKSLKGHLKHGDTLGSCDGDVPTDTTPPALPTHLSPADGVSLTSAALTIVDWSDVTDPSSPVTYVYQSSTSTATNPDGSFSFPAYTSAPLATSEINGSGTPVGTYYWHVRAIDNLGNTSAWTAYWTINVVAPSTDTDGDGIVDDLDNCDGIINADQLDNDVDGIGNACDETPNGDGGSDGGTDGGTSGGETFGLSTPATRGSQGARRGKQTNILGSLVSFFGGNDSQGDVPPGGFGGPGEEEFTDEETNVICRLRKALPENASSTVRMWVAEQLSEKMPHSAEAIAEELKTGSICPTAVTRSSTTAKPVSFHVDSIGFPVSSNDTWNKCVRGTATLQDIRNNPDRDDDGYGVSCSRYHTSSTWRHPDLDMYFTLNAKGVALPAGYALKQDVTVTQK